MRPSRQSLTPALATGVIMLAGGVLASASMISAQPLKLHLTRWRSIAIGRPEQMVGQVRAAGLQWYQASARLPTSIMRTSTPSGGIAWRFQVARGQNEAAPGPNAAIYAERDRSELWMTSGALGGFERTWCVEYDLNIRKAPSSSGQWNVIGQWHAVEDPGDAKLSPVLAFEYNQGVARIVTRYDASLVQRKNPKAQVEWADTSYPLDEWVHWQYQIRFSRGTSNGQLYVFKDRMLIIDKNAVAMGYNDMVPPRFQFGIYRGENVLGAATVDYANMKFVEGACDAHR